MRIRLFTFVIGAISLATVVQASIIFRPGEKVKYIAPGEEEVSGNAQQLNDIAQEAEKKGNINRAIKAYAKLLRKYPHDTLAAAAAYRAGQLLEQTHQYILAANTYRILVVNFPNSPNFEAAIEGQFRIGEMYLAGKKIKLLGIPITTSMEHAVEIFAAIVRTAPYGKYTARAQFDIGLARQKQHVNDAAIEAYQAVIDKFPNDPIAADAQYQIGYIWYESARSGSNDRAAAEKAHNAFEDFLNRYPRSEKASQAREDLDHLQQKSTGDSMKIARFYDKKKAYRAAVIYYNEVIHDQPGSAASAEAQKRVDQIRAKVGPTALQPAVAVTEQKKKQVASRGSSGDRRPAFRDSDAEVAPLPPPEQDSNLPPPASLSPPTTTAPEPSPNPVSSPAPGASATPEPSAAPDSAASPAP